MDRYTQAHKIATPAVSLSAEGGHGAHCYTGNCLTCGWPSEHQQDSIENRTLRQALNIWPFAQIGDDLDGQLIIYTGIYPRGKDVEE